MQVTDYLSNPESQDLDPPVTDLSKGDCQAAWLAYSCRSLACNLCWHGTPYIPAIHEIKCMTVCWLWRLLERLQQVRLAMADSSALALGSSSGTAHNTGWLYVSCTARLLFLFFLPTLLFQPQWCIFIVKGTRPFVMSLLLTCIFLWWELHSFTCFSLVLFCCCSPLKLSEPNSTQGLCLAQLV